MHMCGDRSACVQSLTLIFTIVTIWVCEGMADVSFMCVCETMIIDITQII